MLRAALLATLALLLLPAAAGAYVIQELGGLNSHTNGIALAPDGNFWVTEAGAGTVARITPAGRVLARFPVGAGPTSVAVGGGGRVWVAGTGSDALYKIDGATTATPTVTPVSTAGESACGPVGIVSGGDGRMYFSLPDSGDCGVADDRIGSVADDGSGLTTVTGRGKAFDLAVSGGKLFVPDFGGDAVRRVRLGDLAVESIVTFPIGSLPDGVTADPGGRIWVTLFGAGSLGHFPAAQNGGLGTALPALGLGQPFGITMGADGRVYAAASASAELARVDAAGHVQRYATPGGKPWQIVAGPDGDLYFTDVGSQRILRFVNSAPRATTVAARALANTAGSVDAKVDSRGNATQVVFDYGPTSAYGSTTTAQTVAAGIGESDVRADLPGLEPGTTYHVRVRASNAEGSVTGADVAFTTPKPKPTPVRATVAFRWGFTPSYTILTRVLVRQVARKDTIKLTCKGRGCGLRSKTVRNKKGKVKLTKHFGAERRLRKGTQVRLRITAPDRIGSVTTLTVRSGKDPKITRRCTRPGSKKLRKRC